ncbi:hypothetical protein OPV22_022888 [Ensete ventricosum]|uniref:Uncharacterized protein n=1 Tax=Ensete ventricosum TaxID=4639 RepID=A0AAV8PEK9_ENSVE|nr:hypothetical protein OPV22_022888 [Ensete ventricosum]
MRVAPNWTLTATLNAGPSDKPGGHGSNAVWVLLPTSSRDQEQLQWELIGVDGERSTEMGKYAKNEGGQRIKGRWLASRRRIGLRGLRRAVLSRKKKPSFHSHCLPRPALPSSFEIMLGSFIEKLFILPKFTNKVVRLASEFECLLLMAHWLFKKDDMILCWIIPFVLGRDPFSLSEDNCPGLMVDHVEDETKQWFLIKKRFSPLVGSIRSTSQDMPSLDFTEKIHANLKSTVTFPLGSDSDPLKLPKWLPSQKDKRHERNIVTLQGPSDRLWPVMYHESIRILQ